MKKLICCLVALIASSEAFAAPPAPDPAPAAPTATSTPTATPKYTITPEGKVVCDNEVTFDLCSPPPAAPAPKPMTPEQLKRYRKLSEIIAWYDGPTGPGATASQPANPSATRPPVTPPPTQTTPPQGQTGGTRPPPAQPDVADPTTPSGPSQSQSQNVTVNAPQGADTTTTITNSSVSSTVVEDNGLRLGFQGGAFASSHRPVKDVTGNGLYWSSPEIVLRAGDNEGAYFEAAAGPTVGYYNAYGVQATATGGWAFLTGEVGVTAGYGNYGVWTDRSKRCCDASWRNAILGVTAGEYLGSQVRASLTGSVTPWSRVEVAGGDQNLLGGWNPTFGASITVFLKPEHRVASTASSTSSEQKTESAPAARAEAPAADPDSQPLPPSGGGVQEVPLGDSFAAPTITVDRRPPH